MRTNFLSPSGQVEKSELWVFKAKSCDEGGGEGEGAGKEEEDAGGGGGGGVVEGGGRTDGGRGEGRAVTRMDSLDRKDEDEKRSESPSAATSFESKLFSSTSSSSKPRKRAPPLGAIDRQGSAIDLDIGPPLEVQQTRNYKTIQQILTRMNRLCVQSAAPMTPSSVVASMGLLSSSSSMSSSSSAKKPRKHEQRLLRNMGVHAVVLDLLQIPYDQKEDVRMNELMRLAHEFLQNFCLGNGQNQALLHKHIDLFLTPGVSVRTVKL